MHVALAARRAAHASLPSRLHRSLLLHCAPCHAAGCGHCKRLVPEYSKLGEKIAADPKLKNRVLIAKVDADAHRSLGRWYSWVLGELGGTAAGCWVLGAGCWGSTAPGKHSRRWEACLLSTERPCSDLHFQSGCTWESTLREGRNAVALTHLPACPPVCLPACPALQARSLACVASPPSSGSPAARLATPRSECESGKSAVRHGDMCSMVG